VSTIYLDVFGHAEYVILQEEPEESDAAEIELINRELARVRTDARAGRYDPDDPDDASTPAWWSACSSAGAICGDYPNVNRGGPGATGAQCSTSGTAETSPAVVRCSSPPTPEFASSQPTDAAGTPVA
jgi:hypothetical protein